MSLYRITYRGGIHEAVQGRPNYTRNDEIEGCDRYQIEYEVEPNIRRSITFFRNDVKYRTYNILYDINYKLEEFIEGSWITVDCHPRQQQQQQQQQQE